SPNPRRWISTTTSISTARWASISRRRATSTRSSSGKKSPRKNSSRKWTKTSKDSSPRRNVQEGAHPAHHPVPAASGDSLHRFLRVSGLAVALLLADKMGRDRRSGVHRPGKLPEARDRRHLVECRKEHSLLCPAWRRA